VCHEESTLGKGAAGVQAGVGFRSKSARIAGK
jgi:hypothetical protein